MSIKRNRSCTIVKIMKPSCWGRNSAHFGDPQCCIIYKLNVPFFLFLHVFFLFRHQKIKLDKKNVFNYYLNDLYFLSYYLNVCIVVQLEQTYFCNKTIVKNVF